jgi:malate dehydrogenase (quinone)
MDAKDIDRLAFKAGASLFPACLLSRLNLEIGITRLHGAIAVFLSCFIVSACDKAPPASSEKPVDVVLVGAGIMSATLGTMLKELQPDLTMHMYERLDSVSAESSDAMNNAGTGHAAFAELNYTPETADGGIDTKKAVEINEQFEISKQFWAYQVQKKYLGAPRVLSTTFPI